MKAIYFDMDGTIADLFSYPNWLEELRANNPAPYAKATPLTNMELVNAICKHLAAQGIVIGVISWLAMESNKDYDKATRKAKQTWLKQYFPCVQEVHLVKYGTPKHCVAKVREDAILIDDDATNRAKWVNYYGEESAISPEHLIKYLANLL